MAWTFTQQVQYIAWTLNVTPRTVYRRIRKNELSIDQFEFPDKFPVNLMSVRTTVPTSEDSDPDAVETGPDPISDTPVPVGTSNLSIPTLLEPVLAELRRANEEVVMSREQAAELRERLKWITAERDHLQREVKLLKAPPDPDTNQAVSGQKEEPKAASLLDRIRFAWYGFVKGPEITA